MTAGTAQQRDGACVGRDDDRPASAERRVGSVTTKSIAEHLRDHAEPRGCPPRARSPAPISSTVDSGADRSFATQTAAQVWGSSAAPSGAIMCTTMVASEAASANCDEVEDELDRAQPAVDHERRGGARPVRPAPGRLRLAKSRPNTSGRSPSEKEWALRRNWRWTTHRSATKKPAASPHHGKFGSSRAGR